MDFLEMLKALLFGIVQGITEWLPISSTGHLILLDEFLRLDVSPEFWEMFTVVIQLGSIIAVLVLYFNRLNPFSKRKSAVEQKATYTLWLKILVAAIPAGIVGILLDDFLNAVFYNYITIAVALIVYGVLFIVIENWNKHKKTQFATANDITYKGALYIGLYQMLSLIPGTSRSGSTILGGMLTGASRTAAAEFSFFLAIPVMFGASFLKIVKYGFSYATNEIIILAVGMVTAFAVSIFAIRFLLNHIRRHDFKLFGWYRIALGVCVVGCFLLKVL